jgi:hypothetical protein
MIWQQQKSKIIKGIFWLIVIIALGFLRDFIFVNINYIIDRLYYNLEVYYYHSFYDFLEPLDVSGLMTLKWILTLLFTLINLGLSVVILKLLIVKPQMPLKLLYLGYLVLFLVAGVFFLIGKFSGLTDLGYTLARRFMGVLQSPVPLMIVATVHLMFDGVKGSIDSK